MTVTINSRLAPASAGADLPTARGFIAFDGPADDTEAHLVRSIADLESAYSTTRTGDLTAIWDYLDVAFREGLKSAWVASWKMTNDYTDALALFDAKKGPGNVTIVGETPTETTMAALATHCNTFGRFGVADVATGSDLTAINALGDDLPTTASSAERIALIGPWLSYPAQQGVAGGSSRSVPASAAWLGVMALVDANGNPNRAPGGWDYALRYCDDVALDTTDDEAATALTHGVNLVRVVNGRIQIDSAQTAVAQDAATPFWQVNCSRTRMWMRYYASQIGAKYYMRNIDAEGHVAGQLRGELHDMLMDLYSRDALFGVTPQEAFDVNTGFTINTVDSIASATLKAVTQARLSLYAKAIEIDLVDVPVAGQVVPS